MPTEPHIPESAMSEQTAALARAEAHLRLLRGYFGLQAYGGLVVGGLILLSPVLERSVTIHGKPWLTLPLFAASTWAAFRMRRLLAERNREGVWMAVGTFACSLLAAASASEFGSGAFFSALGILLTVNVYRHARELGF